MGVYKARFQEIAYQHLWVTISPTQVPQESAPHGYKSHTYLYGVNRIAQVSETQTGYFLPGRRPRRIRRGVGGVRDIADEHGAITLTQSYTPYGEVMASEGTAQSAYAFTGESYDPQTGLVYLRARYYDPAEGRFITKDVWEGNYASPNSLNGWGYTEANPISLVDPTGFYSSEPIHAMIQAHFAATYGAGHTVVPEFFVAGGSKQGLQLEHDTKGNPVLTGTPTGQAGFIDIVDISMKQAYEIKHVNEILIARAEITWYVSIYNANPTPGGPPQLMPGTNYRWAWDGWEVIGTNPYYSGQVILAQMLASGVISYKGEYKNKIPVPLPRYVWEWDPDKRTVEKRDRTKIPDWSPYPAPAYSDALNMCKVVVIIGGTLFILIDPLPDEPLLPVIWQFGW